MPMVGDTSLATPDILGAVNQGFDRGQEWLAKSTLAKYAQAAANGDQGAIAKIYQADPGAGMKMQQFGQQQQQQQIESQQQAKQIQDSDMQRLGQHARMVTALANSGDMQGAAQLYSTIYPEASKILGPNLPQQFDPSMLPKMQQVADSMAPQGKKEDSVYHAGDQVYGPDGKLKISIPNKAPNPVLTDTDQGKAWATPGQPLVPAMWAGGGSSSPAPGGLAGAVMQQESGGNPNAVSSAGAQGLMQLMPSTAANPGYGITPARDGSPQENMRVGQQYLQAMQDKYGDTNLALAAYNAGPGRVDGALSAAGGDPMKALMSLPAETQNYVPSVLARAGGDGAAQSAGSSGMPSGRVMSPKKGGETPSGYRYTADGSTLEPIPGGPADHSQATNQGLSPDAITNAAWSDILTGDSGIRGYGKEVSAQRAQIYNMKAQIAKDAGVSPQDLATTKGRNKALQASLTGLQKQSDMMAKSEQAYKNNMGLALSLSQKVDRTGSPVVNKWLLGGKAALGDPDVSALDAAITTASVDYARIMSGQTGAGGTPIATADEAKQMIRKELSQKQFSAVADVLDKDIQGQQAAVDSQRQIIMGHMKDFGSTLGGSSAPAADDKDPLGLLK